MLSNALNDPQYRNCNQESYVILFPSHFIEFHKRITEIILQNAICLLHIVIPFKDL